VKAPLRILIFLFFISLLSCAVKKPPPGGPEDKTPPVIITVNPEAGSVNIPLDSEFSIIFSKDMNRTQTENAVFLTPVFWDYPEMKWSGKKLTIIPPEKLRENKTYVLTIGAGATGHRNNKLGQSFSYAFSTGAMIDSGSVSGAIYADQRGRTIFDIWAYSIPDTGVFNFLREIPDYATQMDSLGLYNITNLSPGNYMIISVNDNNNDLFWDPTSEKIGLPPSIVTISSGESIDNLNIRPIQRDTVLATISRVKSIDKSKIQIEFSQPLLPNMIIKPENLSIINEDSISLGINGLYNQNENIIIVETADQEDNLSYYVNSVGIESFWGNKFDTAGVKFESVADEDTLGPRLLSTKPTGSPNSYYDNSKIELIFSERMKVLGFPNNIAVIADSVDTINFAVKWAAPNKPTLIFNQGIPRERNIVVQLDCPNIYDTKGNHMPDSSLSIKFRFPSADTVGEVTASAEPGKAVIAELISLLKEKTVSSKSADSSGKIVFDNILPGTYNLIYFEDPDSNGVWSPGTINPFSPAENYYFVSDSIKVRSRWTTDVGYLD
jgi:hypothetical protein